MGKYHKLSEMLEDELHKISSDGKLTTSALEVGDKTAHFLKSLKSKRTSPSLGLFLYLFLYLR